MTKDERKLDVLLNAMTKKTAPYIHCIHLHISFLIPQCLLAVAERKQTHALGIARRGDALPDRETDDGAASAVQAITGDASPRAQATARRLDDVTNGSSSLGQGYC